MSGGAACPGFDIHYGEKIHLQGFFQYQYAVEPGIVDKVPKQLLLLRPELIPVVVKEFAGAPGVHEYLSSRNLGRRHIVPALGKLVRQCLFLAQEIVVRAQHFFLAHRPGQDRLFDGFQHPGCSLAGLKKDLELGFSLFHRRPFRAGTGRFAITILP